MIKKKAITTSFAVILIAIVSFLVILVVISVLKEEGDEEAAIQLCRISIAAREKTGIKTPVIGTEREVAPLICPTAKAEDVGKGMTKEEVMKYFANKIAKCWYKYQEGNVKDVFKGSVLTTKCQVCQPFNVKEWKDYKKDDKITNEDLVVFMYNSVYKVREEDDDCKNFGGYCVKGEDECEKLSEERKADFDDKEFKTDDDSKCKKEEENKICCYSPYDCLNKGGICSDDAQDITYREYDKWSCPNGKCWIKEENYYTYLDYVQSYGGSGVVVVLTQDIKPGQSYATSFASPTLNCGDFCNKAAIPGEVVSILGLGGVALGVFTLNPPIFLAGVKVTAIGAAMIGVGVGGAELTTEIAKILKERKINTVYLTNLKDATQGNICEGVE